MHNQPNKYAANWQYGYTLGPPSEANNGDYQIYQNYQQYQQSITPQPAAPTPPQQQPYYRPPAPNNITLTPAASAKPKSWADLKPKMDPALFKTKVFVTSSKPLAGTISTSQTTPAATVTPAVTSTSMPIGPQKPGTSADDDDSAFSSACTQLHELSQQNKIAEKYESAAEPGAGFMITLTLGTEVYHGRGSTIKAGKQNAAMQALANTSYKPRMTMKARPAGVTPTSELHELATKKGLQVDFTFIEPYNFNYSKGMKMWKKEEMRGHYKVKLKVGALEFLGEGDLPQVAKHNAAIQGIPTIRNLPDAKQLSTSVAAAVPGVVSSSSGVIPPGSGLDQHKNPIVQINEIAITRGIHAEWDMLSEEGPPHMKLFKWQLKMGELVAVGVGNSKKIARSQAAANMLGMLPPGPPVQGGGGAPHRKGKKRKQQSMPPPLMAPGTEATADANPVFDPATSTAKVAKTEVQPYTEIIAAGVPITVSTQPMPGKKKGGVPAKGTPVHKVIVTSSAISALYEYCRKASLEEPMFECVSENVLETWQKDNHTFKKIEYTMRLIVADKTYFATGNTKKVAKNRVAEEGWNVIRAGTF